MEIRAVGRFRPKGTDQLQAVEGGGCLSLFGLPFFLAGIFVVLIGIRVVPIDNASDVPPWGWPLFVLMGLAFVTVGGALILGRRWITLDAGRRTIRKEWGLLRPMRGEEHSLQDYDAVLIRFEAGDSDSADRYPVLLRTAVGSADFPLVSSTQYGESREQAAAAAKLLDFPLVDATTDHEAVSAAGRVDANLRERLQAGDEPYEEAARPLRMQSEVRETGRGIEIVLSRPGFRRGALIGLVVAFGILWCLGPDLLEFFRRTRTPEGVQSVFFTVVLFFLVGLPLLSLAKALVLARRGRTLVTASPEGLVIEERAVWRTRTTRIPAADIVDLDYGTAENAFRVARRGALGQLAQAGRPTPPRPCPGREAPPWVAALRRLASSKGISVKSRTGLHTFGAGLPDEEICYLHALLVRTLGGDRHSRW